MKIKVKTKPRPPPDFTSTNSNNNFEQKTIPELINILRGTCQFDTYDTIESVLVNRDMRLRTEKLQMQELLRIQAEEEVKKRDELCEKGKRVQESYENLLKEGKAGLAYRDTNTIKELKKKNDDLECEVKNLKEKCADDSNKFDVMRTKNAELEYEVLELTKLNEKLVKDNKALDELRGKVRVLEDDKFDVMRTKNAELEYEVLELTKLNEKLVKDNKALDELRGKVRVLEDDKFDVMRTKNAELEYEVFELTKLNEKLVKDNKALDELRGKVRVLEDDKYALGIGLKIKISELEERVKNHLTTISELGEEKSKLADEKRKFEILYKSLFTKHRELQERVLKFKEVAKLLMNVDASGGGNNEREPRADPMVADLEDLITEEDVLSNVFGHHTVEAAPLRKNDNVHDSLGVAASTQPQNIGGNDAQGASSASGRVKQGKESKIMILDDDDHRSISQRVHGKKTIFGPAVKDEYPSSSVATQQKSKFTNAVVDAAKRKFSFPDIETSSDDSSDDSFFDSLPISSVTRKKAKNVV